MVGQGNGSGTSIASSRGRTRLLLGVALMALAAISAAAISSAGAAPPICSDPPAPTTSPDGTAVFGSACSDTIVITSPLVEEVYGGEGNDVIYADATVEEVRGGGGDDVIYGENPGPDRVADVPEDPAPAYAPEGEATAGASTYEPVDCTGLAGDPCYGGPGSQEMMGGEGKDTIFGQRGNDALFGEGETDALYGGIGDDKAYGGANNDLVTGGFGTDRLDGGNGNDLTRGDATGDELKDQGEKGVDTVSYATAGSPGFEGVFGVEGFPADASGQERGVNINLSGTACSEDFEACNSSALFGGGKDHIDAGAFENVIGSPFADLIRGSGEANRIDGGGGPDVIYGGAGNDTINGGAEGDYIEGGADHDLGNGEAGTDNCAADVETRPDCQGTALKVTQRDRSKISVGVMVADPPESAKWAEVYVLGSNSARDEVTVEYTPGTRRAVFKAGASSTFDLSPNVATKGCEYKTAEVACTLPEKPDAILLAGVGGDDQIAIGGFDPTTSPVINGGEGNDVLYGSGTTEDVLVDGVGTFDDKTYGFKFDDALVNYLGVDNLQAGLGNDLLVSGTVCEGDILQGAESKEGGGDGGDRNNASWALLPEASGAVWADLFPDKAGNKSGGECTAGTPSSLLNIDDLEGSNQADHLFGDGNNNSLFARTGVDELISRGGDDFINAAEDETHDTIRGGDQVTAEGDECKFDLGIDSHEGCETLIPWTDE
jgi:Ca2+-binding RTX toxin-like protein